MNVSFAVKRSLLLWIVVAALVQGCGWHLRGSQQLELALPSLYLDARQGSAELQRELVHALDGAGVERVQNRSEARLLLRIDGEERVRRVLSVNGSGRVREYGLQYRLTYSIIEAGEALIDHETISRQRDYLFDENDVLAKDQEQAQLFDVMRTNAIVQLMRRLQSVASHAD